MIKNDKKSKPKQKASGVHAKRKTISTKPVKKNPAKMVRGGKQQPTNIKARRNIIRKDKHDKHQVSRKKQLPPKGAANQSRSQKYSTSSRHNDKPSYSDRSDRKNAGKPHRAQKIEKPPMRKLHSERSDRINEPKYQRKPLPLSEVRTHSDRVNEPKYQRKQIHVSKPVPQLRFSDVRLKVRNIDNQKVKNDEIRKLFESMGELVMCKFDYSNFGMFLGSATVQYKKPEDAKKAIQEYHEGELDGKVITVENDILQAG